MVQNLFNGTLFNTTDAMLKDIAYEWITAGGLNSPDQVDEILEEMDVDALTDECIEGWTLNQEDEDEGSHMEQNDYTRADLRAAIQEFIETRPDRNEEED